MPVIGDEGVCLRVWDWSETSQTLAVFSRQHGVLRCVAKGSKRGDTRFSGGIEPLTRAEFQVSVRKSDAMSVLASWELAEVFPAARRSLEAFYAGTTMLDAVRHCLHEQDPHPDLYDALLRDLRGLDAPAGPGPALLGFLWSTLADTGHAPELARDVGAGTDLPAAPSYVFDARRGGLTTDAPANAERPGAWRIRAETVDLLRAVSTGSSSAAPPAAVDRATRLLALCFREVFGVEPPTFRRLLGTDAK
ncbi:MAG: DNA repair protein RecO [Planctomycetota bacterium]|nr:DNA repair protein RecO [Planctomycetota bacterium]